MSSEERKRRTDSAEGEADEELQRLQKRQRMLTDMARPLTREREHYTATQSLGGGNTAVLPPTASKVDSQRDRLGPDFPRQEDSVEVVISKLTAILDVVRAGRSIAKTMPGMATPVTTMSQMPPLEYEAWATFNNGDWRLPELDWDNNTSPPPTSSKSLKVASRRAEVLNRLYKTNRAHEGHVAWITQNKIEILPLIKAMAPVIGAEINLVGGGEWQATQLADLQLANRILSVSAQICQRSKSGLLRSKGAEIQHVLGDYRRKLQSSRLGKPASVPASGEINKNTIKKCDESQGGIPKQFEVKRVFPKRGLLRLHRLIKSAAFNCDRCGNRKTSKLVAFAQGR